MQGISIPHGTIKSKSRVRADLAYLRFQFHMVRLKAVDRISNGHRHDVISIPHGTIKRQDRAQLRQQSQNFNSTWYD